MHSGAGDAGLALSGAQSIIGCEKRGATRVRRTSASKRKITRGVSGRASAEEEEEEEE